MIQFRPIGLSWIALGAVGLILTIGEIAADRGLCFYREEGLEWLAEGLLFGLLALTAAVAGYGLFRGWRWPRIAIEVVAAIVLVHSLIGFLCSDRPADWRRVAFVLSLFSLYSLVICLFVKYESHST
jgi:hypothetical protein